MNTKVVKLSGAKTDLSKLESAAHELVAGGVVVFPTDTVYGIAANAFDAKACKKIYALKGRSYRKPLTLMVRDLKALRLIAEVPDDLRKLIDVFWPGQLTLIFRTTHIGNILTGGRKNIGVRIPDSAVVRGLLQYCEFPIATTSANPSGKESAKTGRDAMEYFRGKADMVIDGGRCEHNRESTVVDVQKFPYVVIREGCLKSKKLLKYI